MVIRRNGVGGRGGYSGWREGMSIYHVRVVEPTYEVARLCQG
jgi:hypothetical protein